jgi:hypothetical protein
MATAVQNTSALRTANRRPLFGVRPRVGPDYENVRRFIGIESASSLPWSSGAVRASFTVWLPSQQEVLALRSDWPNACACMSRSE